MSSTRELESTQEIFELFNGLTDCKIFIKKDDNENIKKSILTKNWAKEFTGIYLIQKIEEEQQLFRGQKRYVSRTNSDDVLAVVKLGEMSSMPKLLFPFYIPKNLVENLFTADSYDSSKLIAIFECISKAPIAARNTLITNAFNKEPVAVPHQDINKEEVASLFKQLFALMQNPTLSVKNADTSQTVAEIKVEEGKKDKVADIFATALATGGKAEISFGLFKNENPIVSTNVAPSSEQLELKKPTP